MNFGNTGISIRRYNISSIAYLAYVGTEPVWGMFRLSVIRFSDSKIGRSQQYNPCRCLRQLHFLGNMPIPIIGYIDLSDDIGIDHIFEFLR